MAGKDILITGLPRSGNTLANKLLADLPDVVAIDEGMRLVEFEACPTPDWVATATRRFLREQRHLILEEGQVWTSHQQGKLTDNVFTGPKSDQGRARSVSQGWIDVGKAVTPEFTLLLKQPVAFAATIDRLAQEWPVYAFVRNPLAALGSWNSVNFGLRSGRAGLIEKYHPALTQQLLATPDVYDRQILILHWFFEQFSRHLPRHAVIRYEDLITSGGRALAPLHPAAEAFAFPLSSRNSANDYDLAMLMTVGDKLLASHGAAWTFYQKAEVKALLDEMLAGGMTPVR